MKTAFMLSLLFAAQVGSASPVFKDHSATLPEHIYSGGWEHFVGGGIAVFDCDDDDLPDIFAAGGQTLQSYCAT